MARQSRDTYRTKDMEVNRIFGRIADRLDVLEGLRPDLSAGLIELESDKDITTRGAGTMASQGSSDVSITGGSVDGVIIGANEAAASVFTKVQVIDSNGTVIHQIGDV